MKKFLILLIPVLSVTLLLGSCEDLLMTGKEAIHGDPVIKDNHDYMIILGDLQAMTAVRENRKYLNKTMEWINNQVQYRPGRIKAVIQNGDITDGNTVSEWSYARDVCLPTAEVVPFIVSTGNHDYYSDKKEAQRRFTRINEYFYDFSKGLICKFGENRMENAIYEVEFGNDRFYILALEFAPRKETVEWALQYIESHKEQKFIIVNHEFLKSSGDIEEDNKSYASFMMQDSINITPKGLWNTLIYPNDNVRALICGHNGFCKIRYDTNISGRSVPQILFNLQYQKNGGGGLLMLWETVDGKDIEVNVYNTIKREFPDVSKTSFKITL